MEVFLPIAQVFINPVEILLLSAIVGVLSGLFGVGGGFLMTPFLIFLGIPPVYAVPNEINNILATSVSGSLTHWFKNTLDYKMGMMIIVGGIIGTILGIIALIVSSVFLSIQGIVIAAVTAISMIISYLVVPATNKARDKDRHTAFRRLHTLTVVLTLFTLLANLSWILPI